MLRCPHDSIDATDLRRSRSRAARLEDGAEHAVAGADRRSNWDRQVGRRRDSGLPPDPRACPLRWSSGPPARSSAQQGCAVEGCCSRSCLTRREVCPTALPLSRDRRCGDRRLLRLVGPRSYQKHQTSVSTGRRTTSITAEAGRSSTANHRSGHSTPCPNWSDTTRTSNLMPMKNSGCGSVVDTATVRLNTDAQLTADEMRAASATVRAARAVLGCIDSQSIHGRVGPTSLTLSRERRLWRSPAPMSCWTATQRACQAGQGDGLSNRRRSTATRWLPSPTRLTQRSQA
jgi:hypothetical protein